MEPILNNIIHEVEFSYNNKEFCVNHQGKVYLLCPVFGDDGAYEWRYIDEKCGRDDYDFVKQYGLKVIHASCNAFL